MRLSRLRRLPAALAAARAALRGGCAPLQLQEPEGTQGCARAEDRLRDAIWDAAALVDAMARGDQEWAEHAIRLGDPPEMLRATAYFLAGAIRRLPEDAAAERLAGFRAWGSDPGSWSDYDSQGSL
jgi:hypothetical protein